ncbi:MAG: DNA mismatch repair endonuclease MutL, partial [Clostridia bacterium]|nr:DNA mismatch repair endonuclease MutL [Clostridia bacterium]
MGKINVLSFEVANLIAAGEVVDRPASAIKEMMENAIDAGASRITVEIQNGGVTFMRVSDNGHGMPPEDLPMAIRRHATSKISEAQDLDGICTLGFRGEALAAIAAVSRLRIMSKTPDAALGAQMDVHCGEIVDIVERGCAVGTTVIAEDLFANVPARRKFLKRDVTEAMAVSANVEKIALSHPEIAFRLIIDGNVKLDTAGDGSLKSAVWSVFGKDFASRLIEVDGEYEGITVKGFIGRPDNARPNRNYQNFFINSRYVKSKTASAALEQAFTSFMAPDKFPCCVLFIGLNPTRVDVNVHPAKLEVKFTNEKPVFESVYYAVRQALEANTARPELQIPTKKPSVSDAFTSVERGESLQKRQVGMDIAAPAQPKAENKWEHLTAQQYVEQYIQGKKPVGANHDSPAQPTSVGAIHKSPAQPTSVGANHDSPAQPTPVGAI